MREKKRIRTDDEVVRYRITNPNAYGADGAEFEVDADATEAEIAKAACEAFLDAVSYGHERIEEDE